MTLCVLCPGQGGQSPAMFARLLGDPAVAPHLRHCAQHLSWDVMAVAADPERCFLNRYAQPLVVLYGLAVAAALEEAGVCAALVAGYSVGELTAHAVSGALGAAQALDLAERRAACMDKAAPAGYGMLAVRGIQEDNLARHAQRAGAVIAIRNGADHAVLAGSRAALAQLADACAGLGAHVVPLRVSVPAHSLWLAAAVEPFGEALAGAEWQPQRVPVLAGISGQPVYTAGEAMASLRRQLAEPVHWALTLDVAREMGATAFIEIGPGRALTRMVRERFPDVPARAVDEFASVQGAAAWLRHHV